MERNDGSRATTPRGVPTDTDRSARAGHEGGWEVVVDRLPIGAAVWSRSLALIHANAALRGVLGLHPGVGHVSDSRADLLHLVLESDRPRAAVLLSEMLDGGHPTAELRLAPVHSPSGVGVRSVRVQVTVVHDGEGEVGGFLGQVFDLAPGPSALAADEPLASVSMLARDLTDLRDAEQRLRQLATHDYLTGLPNRLLLYDRLELALGRFARYASPVALMYCDLDGFKPVNDRFGHQVGDDVLVTVADRIHDVVREVDTAARVGGDEFVVLVEGVDDVAQLTRLAERLVARVSEPIAVGAVTVRVGVSVGAAVASLACAEVDALMALADNAMYRAKTLGRGCVVLLPGL